MINIGSIKKESTESFTRIKAKILIPDDALNKWKLFSKQAKKYSDYSYLTSDYLSELSDGKELYFQVDNEHAHALVSNVSDSFVVALLYYAMIVGHDIVCESPVSEELLFNLNAQFIPQACKASGIPAITVHAPAFSKVIHGSGKVATGMSAGVDSLSALQHYASLDVPKAYRINCLTNFDVGSERYYFLPGQSADELERFQQKFNFLKKGRQEKARTISINLGFDFVTVDSNVSDFYQGCFERSHIYRSAAAALALQGYFSIYYIASSGCEIHDYQLDLNKDPAHYEQFLVPLLSTSSLRFYVACKDLNRIEKVHELASFKLARDNLMVCGKGELHCYSCSKEYRTLIVLDILNDFHSFEKVFDPEKSKRALWRAYFWLLKEKRKKDPSSFYLFKEASELNKIPLKSYLYYIVWLLATPVRTIRNRRGKY